MNIRTVAASAAQMIIFALLFWLAWRSHFWQMSVYLAILTIASIGIVIYLWLKDPELLKRRSRGPQNETSITQKLIHSAIVAALFVAIAVACFDHAYGWSQVPLSIELVGDALLAIGCFIYFIVFRENTYAAATIEVVPEQRVVSSGPYALVRHPMYLGLFAVALATPLALGSWWAMLLLIPTIIILQQRMVTEEAFLREHLPGYDAYMMKVRRRVIPGAW